MCASCARKTEQYVIVSWFSAGVSSAVATKMANPDKIIYIDIDDQHSDTYRFIADCEKWFGQKIEVLKSPLCSIENCCYAASFIRGPKGAACTNRLKKRVRKEWEYSNPGRHTYVWGFDCNERHRSDGTERAMSKYDHVFPILDRSKSEVHGILYRAGVKRPAMYDMEYPNNNCIGCVKGGMGYWNKIRIDFPDVFERRSAMERKIGAHILKECFLDELKEDRGRDLEIIVPDCGMFCETEYLSGTSCAKESGQKNDTKECLQTAHNMPNPQ